MSFVHPAWLAAGLAAVLVLWWTWWRYDARQRRALTEFVSAHLSAELTRSISTARRRLKRGLFAVAVALLFVALAEPQAGFRWEEVKRRGNDIVFAVDTSRSMLTPDVKPNRLARAKLAIDDFVGRLDGDAVGLVAFAGSAFVQCPLTVDYGAFQESLAALDTRIIPRGGTDISSAIEAAQAVLRNRTGSDKILILLTDGEDLEGDALQAARSAAKQIGLKIYTVGVGTANGDLIPLPAEEGGGFLKDQQGRFVRSRLDEGALRAIAQATGGAYAPLGAENQGLDTIYREAIAPLAKHDLAMRSQRIYIERYQWPLAGCLALLLASILVGTRRRSAARSGATAARPSSAAASSGGASDGDASRGRASGAVAVSAAVMAIASLAPAHSAHASTASAAASAYQQGDFAKAQRDYAAAAAGDPAQPVLKFDAGTAAYKAGDFPTAAKEFQDSLNTAKSGSSERLAQQQDAYYNLGNTLYRQGEKTAAGDAQKTIQTWTGAVKAYDAALQLRPDDPDSKFNRDFVNKKLEQLKQQQKQPQQNQSQGAQNESQSGDKSRSSGASQSAAPSNSNNDQQHPGNQSQQAQSQAQQQQAQQQQAQQQQAQQQQGQQQQGQQQQGQSQQPPQQSPQEQARQQGQAPQGQAQQQQTQQGQSGKGQQQAQSTPAPQGESQGPRQGAVSSAANPPQTAQNTGGAEEGANQRIPGQMTPEEARELLDSVKDEERRAPSAENSERTAMPEQPARDW